MSSNKKHTFAQRLRLQLIIAAIGFVAAIAVSFSYIVLRTVDYTDAKMTVLAAQSFVEKLDSGQVTTLPKDPSMQGFNSWENIPAKLRQPFEQMELTLNEITETTFINQFQQEAYIGILPLQRQNGETIYFISEYGFDESNQAYQEIINNFLFEALWLLLSMFLALFFFVFWLLKRANEPISLLNDWATQLQSDKGLAEPDFSIVEVDNIAKQLKHNIDKLTAYNEREKQFLKYASHELRTPQATMQACLDTLHLQLDGAKRKTVDRALRANLTMSRLSSALLWLSRESTAPIKKEKVDLRALSEQLLTENKHLIDNKDLTLKVEIKAETILIEGDLLLIVFSNLLRNACQHAEQGQITVNLCEKSLTISNDVSHNLKSNEVDSFGLGLHLVASVCKKLNWQFSSINKNDKIAVTVNW